MDFYSLIGFTGLLCRLFRADVQIEIEGGDQGISTPQRFLTKAVMF